MTLAGARVACSATRAERIDITIHRGRVQALGARPDRDSEIDLSGHLILPGLINAHDHLEFNLFPRLGRGPYANAAAWAGDVYRPTDPPVRDQLRVPKATRLFWGGLKNLLSGVTTVAHHNPYEREVFTSSFPVRVVRRFGWAHSLDFSSDVVERFRRTPRRWPFVIHAGEGTDQHSRDELSCLDHLRVLSSRSVLVHAVAADAAALAIIARRRTALIWCPSSNLFTLGQTINGAVLGSGTPIALGTDSALTGEGDLLDELRVARKVSGLELERLYDMVTTDAASILRLTRGEGAIREQAVADLLVVRDRGHTPAETLFDMQPELVMVGGRIRLISPSLARRVNLPVPCRQPVEIESRGEWLTDLDLRKAFEVTVPALGSGLQLAGREVRL